MSKRISKAFAVIENNVYLTLFEKGTTEGGGMSELSQGRIQAALPFVKGGKRTKFAGGFPVCVFAIARDKRNLLTGDKNHKNKTKDNRI